MRPPSFLVPYFAFRFQLALVCPYPCVSCRCISVWAQRQVERAVQEKLEERGEPIWQQWQGTQEARLPTSPQLSGFARQPRDWLSAPGLQTQSLDERWGDGGEEEGKAGQRVSREVRREEDLINDASGEMM